MLDSCYDPLYPYCCVVPVACVCIRWSPLCWWLCVGRILFGKMRGKAAKNRMSLKERRDIIVRFLVGAKPEEFSEFTRLLFAPVQHLLNGQCQ